MGDAAGPGPVRPLDLRPRHARPAQLNPDAFEPQGGDGVRWGLGGDAFVDAAREANGNNAIESRTVTRMAFAGSPVFVFIQAIAESRAGLPPRDHRDNLNGEFAFGTFHPGISTLQLPWAL